MYRIAVYHNPKGRTPQPHSEEDLGNKREAIRRARKLLRRHWGFTGADVKLVRVSVRADKRLLYQARIDEESALTR